MSLDNKVVDLADLKVSHDYLLGQDELLSDRINELGSGIDGIQSQITALGNGSPIPVETVAEMTDNTKAYLYTGSEQGYTSGYWYTYDSTQAKFVPRGEYGAGVIIDSTLTVTGNAADAKATGDAIKAGKTFVVQVPGSASVLSGSITAGDFAKALAAYTAGSGVYAVKDGEVYQLSAVSSSTITFTQMYHGTMNFIKQIQITSADTFTVTNTVLSSSATDTSYSNTASGLTATNVQAAIDENAAAISSTNGRLAQYGNGIAQLDNGKVSLYPDITSWYRGYFKNTGEFVSTTTNAAPTNEPFLVTSGRALDIYPNGLSVSLRQFTKSGDTYTHVSVKTYTENASVTFDADTYISIHVNKTSGATLTLDEVTTKLWIASNIQHQIDGLSASIDDVETSTTAQITAVDAKATDGINRLTGFLFEDGDAVTIQKNTAESFLLNNPNGYIHVKSTNEKIYTGTINFIDLFGLAQGSFTDSGSGVTIEVNGNEVYIHGSPTKGFRFDIQKGQFYTDAFSNHPADFSNFPNNRTAYRFCWWEKDGYSLPSNIYIGVYHLNGSFSSTNLQGHAKDVYQDVPNQCVALYSNTAISNLDIKFTIGFKIAAMPGTFASIEAVAKSPYGTTVIATPGYYECGSFTWTGASNTYDVVQTDFNAEADPLTNGHVYAWFGDSLSQLKELPNIVSDLLNVKVYDCTFAGAPLTYGDPTKYQPTGFMSLTSQIVAHDFTPLSDAIDAQEQAGTVVTEKRIHLATLQSLDFNEVTDIVLLAGTNDFDNDYVNATKFTSGFTNALTTLLTAYPHLMVYVISPPWRGDKTEGVTTIPTMEDIVRLEKEVADTFCLPFYDLYHRSGINTLTATVYLTNDLLHPSDAGDALLANKCAKFIQSN